MHARRWRPGVLRQREVDEQSPVEGIPLHSSRGCGTGCGVCGLWRGLFRPLAPGRPPPRGGGVGRVGGVGNPAHLQTRACPAIANATATFSVPLFVPSLPPPRSHAACGLYSLQRSAGVHSWCAAVSCRCATAHHSYLCGQLLKLPGPGRREEILPEERAQHQPAKHGTWDDWRGKGERHRADKAGNPQTIRIQHRPS
jgi:hypothetical protein